MDLGQAKSGDAAPKADARPWSLWHYPDFCLLVLSRLSYGLGANVQTVAIGWMVYEVTRSAFMLGYLGLAGFLPAVALLLVTGYVADRFPRVLVMASATAVMATSSALLLADIWEGEPAIWPIYLLVAAYAAARAFYQPASQALTPELVDQAHLSNAVSVMSGSAQVATIVGPAIGGLLYAVDGRLPFVMAGVCFAIAAGSVLLVRRRITPARREPTTWTSLLAGLQFAFSKPIVLGAISLDMFAVLFGGATALMPIYARDILGTGAWGLGLLRSAPAIGALVMVSVLSYRSEFRRSGHVLLLAVVTYGLATIGFGLSQHFLLSFACLVLVGAADVVSVVVRLTIVQVETPDHLRGRVSAVNSLFITTSNDVGELEAGLLAGLIGAVPSVVVGGLGAIAIAGLWWRLFPDLRDRDQLVPPS